MGLALDTRPALNYERHIGQPASTSRNRAIVMGGRWRVWPLRACCLITIAKSSSSSVTSLKKYLVTDAACRKAGTRTVCSEAGRPSGRPSSQDCLRIYSALAGGGFGTVPAAGS